MDIDEILTRGVAEVINRENLKRKLVEGNPLRIKYGVDPTRPDIHLGHAVAMWKLKALQDLGHTIIFLIGDYTTKIGDPSGRNATRPILTDEEIKENAKTYFDQVGQILNMDKTEIRYNSEWFDKINFANVLNLFTKFTVAQIIERDDFTKRLKEGNDIGFQEMIYPLMQAYDSVELKADVEIGGTDQKFNILAGRDLQKKMGQNPQDIILMKLLVGTDGKIKMSKSTGNYVAVTDSANDMFGKVMSIPDSAIIEYYELATDVTQEAIDMIKKELDSGKNPRDIKAELAKLIVEKYHNAKEAEEAEAEFNRVFKNREMPTDIQTKKVSNSEINIIDLIIEVGFAESRSDARRLVEQGGVEVANQKITDPGQIVQIENEMILKVGKTRFTKLAK